MSVRAEVVVAAEAAGYETASLLAAHPDVHVERRDTGWVSYRFTLPTRAEIDWDPEDGWYSPCHAIDAIVEWMVGR